jgi:cytochrome c oxidase subunit 1
MDWITTVDHKKIGILYLFAGLLFFAIGGLEALFIRLQLAYPMNDVVSAQRFNELITMHGTTMLFLAALPILYGFFNFIIPLQIGARDVAFPFLNSLGFWTFFFGGVLLNIGFFTGDTLPDSGWTAYAPLATEYSAGRGMDMYSIGLQLSGIGTLLGGLNFVVTIVNMRAPGMTMMRMPLFCWTAFITSILIVFAFSALAVGLLMISFDRLFGGNFFNTAAGGNEILWQHIFWIFGHPEVYILVLPAFGILSEVIPTFSRKRLFGYTSMVFATSIIGFLGFMVWAHHMFTVGMGAVANTMFAVATMLIAVPTGIKIFNWIFTMWKGQIRFTAANLFAIGFIPSFTIGGVTGVMLAMAASDYVFHDTYFVVAHFHYVIVGGTVHGIFAALFYWFPKMFGRTLNETLGKITFWLLLIGFNLTFFIQHWLGVVGMPRRVYTYLDGQPGWNEMNLVSTIGALLMGVSVVILVINIVITLMKPKNATNDPWEDGRTMEWAIPSPPPEYNFKQTPLVRGLDAWWVEKRAGNKEMTPAEPVGPIHMPNGSILPFIMSIGLFIAGIGFMYDTLLMIVGGLGILVICMILRSLIDDPGYHIEPEEIEGKGVKA